MANDITTEPLQPGRVLLVDDEAPIRRLYGQVLRRAGFVVLEVPSGRSLRELLNAEAFDVVITDLMMPESNGIDLLLEAHKADPDLSVIIMTGATDLTPAVKAVEYGARRYLLKPVAAAVLTEAVVDAVAARRTANTRRRAVEHYAEVVQQQWLRAELAARFERALDTVHIVCQPIVTWSRRSIVAYEALVRTSEPSLANPNDLLTAADALGRTQELGREIRRRVADLMGSNDDAEMFVNLHPCELDDHELFDPDSPLAAFADRVVLEVTERASLAGTDVRERFAALRALGYRLAVDDLGAGYSGLSSLTEMKPEVVKVDMSLVRGITIEPAKQTLIRSIVTACRELGMLLVTEGVETPDERDALLQLGCDLFQGYLFARPGPGFPAVDWGGNEIRLVRPNGGSDGAARMETTAVRTAPLLQALQI